MFWHKRILIYADFIDPFCYIGFFNLSRAAAPRWSLEWRGFELNPDTPAEGMALDAAPNSDARKGMWTSVAAYAQRAGLTIQEPRFVSNTQLAHRLILGAPKDVKIPLIGRIYQAYFSGQVDIGNVAILNDLAHDFGMSESAITRALADEKAGKRLNEFRTEAFTRRFAGLPGFVYGRQTCFGALPQDEWKRKLES